MKNRWVKAVLLVFYFGTLILLCIHPVYPDEMLLQHSVTIAIATILIYIAVKNNLSNKAFLFIVVFMVFHMIGARWIYSYTPYDQWISRLAGFSINEYFGFQRNQYDRLVHFLFGFLMVYPVREVYARWFNVPGKFLLHLAVMFILSVSMIYEVFEWSISIFLSPEDAEAYNGQQGDFWDAQKDMALAFLGAVLMSLLLLLMRKKA
jgi:putative membrane protein